MKNNELAVLVRRVQHDRKAHFGALYNATWDTVFYLALNMMGSMSDAEDIAQQAFLKIYDNIEKLEVPEAFNSWMNRLVLNLCNDELRKRGLEVDQALTSTELVSGEAPSNFYSDPHDELEQKETRAVLRNFISELPVKQKEAVLLFYFEELRIAEIAEVLGISITAVQGRLHKARTSLRNHIARAREGQKLGLDDLRALALLPFFLKRSASALRTSTGYANVWQAVASARPILSPFANSQASVWARVQHDTRPSLQQLLRRVPVQASIGITAAAALVAAMVGVGVWHQSKMPQSSAVPQIQTQNINEGGDTGDLRESAAATIEENPTASDTSLTDERRKVRAASPAARTSTSQSTRKAKRKVASKKTVSITTPDATKEKGAKTPTPPPPTDVPEESTPPVPPQPPTPPIVVPPTPATPVVGSLLYFGNEQGTPFAWRILDRQSEVWVLLSEYVSVAGAYRSSTGLGLPWDYAYSDLRTWLKDSWLTTTFTPAEQAVLLSHTSALSHLFPLSPQPMLENDTVMVPSAEELSLFSELSTPTARAAQASVWSREHTGYDNTLLDLTRDGFASWWLRESTVSLTGKVPVITADGSVGSELPTNASVGVRPLIGLDPSMIETTVLSDSGAGSFLVSVK